VNKKGKHFHLHTKMFALPATAAVVAAKKTFFLIPYVLCIE
jgi:hypothetical protein